MLQTKYFNKAIRLSLLALFIIISGCGRSSSEKDSPAEGTNKEKAPINQASQPVLKNKLLKIFPDYLGEIRYFQGEMDLNEDGQQEIITHIVGPQVCGTGGCETLVFTQDSDTLRLVSEITVTHPPIIAAETKTNGWRDLIVAVGGGGAPSAHSARMKFDGKTYPRNPTVEPAQQVESKAEGTVLIATYQSFEEGQLLRKGEAQ